MNPEKQRVKIAEACGWKYITPSLLCGYAPWRRQYEAKDIPTDGSLPFDTLPDYPNDLDELHGVERMLLASQQDQYLKWLEHLFRSELDDNNFYLVHATAKQRCEAILRTLNLWEQE